MKLKKVNDTYHVCFKAEDGSMMQADTKKTDYQEATEIAESAKVEELERVANITRLTNEIVTKIVNGKEVRLRDALSRYEVWANNNLTRRTAQSHVSYAAKFIDDENLRRKSPEEVTDEIASNFINPRKSSIKASTRRVRKAAIKSFLDYCYNKGWMTHRPAHLCKVKMDLLTHKQKETKSHQSLTSQEIGMVLKYCNDFWKTAVHLASETGLRLGDICSLEWDSIDPSAGKITVWTDKSDKRVSLNMSKGLAETLSNIPLTDTTYVFPAEREVYLNTNRRSWLSSEFKRIIEQTAVNIELGVFNAELLNRPNHVVIADEEVRIADAHHVRTKAAELRRKSFHGLRGYYAKKKAKGGATKEDVAKDLGHSSTETTDIYLNGES